MYYYLVFCILAGAGLVHLARRERSKPVSAVRKAIPTRNDPWVWWARYLIVLFVAAVLLALSGCTPKAMEPTHAYDQCARAEMLKSCMVALPAGPVSSKYNDWDEVVGECGTQAARISWRRIDQIKPECQG